MGRVERAQPAPTAVLHPARQIRPSPAVLLRRASGVRLCRAQTSTIVVEPSRHAQLDGQYTDSLARGFTDERHR